MESLTVQFFGYLQLCFRLESQIITCHLLSASKPAFPMASKAPYPPFYRNVGVLDASRTRFSVSYSNPTLKVHYAAGLFPTATGGAGQDRLCGRLGGIQLCAVGIDCSILLRYGPARDDCIQQTTTSHLQASVVP